MGKLEKVMNDAYDSEIGISIESFHPPGWSAWIVVDGGYDSTINADTLDELAEKITAAIHERLPDSAFSKFRMGE